MKFLGQSADAFGLSPDRYIYMIYIDYDIITRVITRVVTRVVRDTCIHPFHEIEAVHIFPKVELVVTAHGTEQHSERIYICFAQVLEAGRLVFLDHETASLAPGWAHRAIRVSVGAAPALSLTSLATLLR